MRTTGTKNMATQLTGVGELGRENSVGAT